MTPVAPRIVNEVSCVMMSKQARHFALQAHYLRVALWYRVVLE